MPVKTLVIGNLIIGGSGKTQLVLYLAKLFTKKNIKVGIISRGYKGKLNDNREVHQNSDVNIVGDEPNDKTILKHSCICWKIKI